MFSITHWIIGFSKTGINGFGTVHPALSPKPQTSHGNNDIYFHLLNLAMAASIFSSVKSVASTIGIRYQHHRYTHYRFHSCISSKIAHSSGSNT
jgi:hypothetical protein